MALMEIRAATAADWPGIWPILEPIIRAGETYALPQDMGETAAQTYWMAPGHQVFVVAHESGDAAGTYYLRRNQQGGGSHVCNCGYATATAFRGLGLARAMCEHSLGIARDQGYRAMQFNFVVSTNERAVRLWAGLGFEIVGRLPSAFRHPTHSYVEALVMWRKL